MTIESISIDKFVTARFLLGSPSKEDEYLLTENGPPKSLRTEVIARYKFSWGSITERYVGDNFIVFSFILHTPASHDGQAQYRDMAYNLLAKEFPEHSEEQAILVAGLHDDWCIYPGAGENMFVVATTHIKDSDARHWINNNIIKETLPKLIKQIYSRD